MRTYIVTLLVSALLGAVMGGGQSVYAATNTVTSTANNGAGTLRAALASVANGDTINFSVATPAAIMLTSGELVISNNVTILGPGLNSLGINGNFASRVFRITPGKTVTMSSLAISNGNASGVYPATLGGGIYNDGSTLTVTNCLLLNNTAEYGGGIFNRALSASAMSTIRASFFINNSSLYGGGAIYNDGNEGLPNNATLTIGASTINNNVTSSGPGGAVLNNGGNFGTATLTISNSTLYGNLARDGGGAIYNTTEAPAAGL